MPDETHQEQTATYIRRRDGSSYPLTRTEEAVVPTEDGGQRYEKVETRIETENGDIASATDIAWCKTCETSKGPWSKYATRICASCGCRNCLQHTKITDAGNYCKPCMEEQERKERKKFFTSPF